MAATRRPGKEIGTSGLNITAMGTVDDEPSPNLRGRKAIRVYREMRDNDATVGAIFFAIENLIRQVDWHVVPHPDGVPERAEHLEQCMGDMSHSWGDLMSEVISMLPYGFAPMEIVYKTRNGPKPRKGKAASKYTDGRVGWRKISLRSQDTVDRWAFDENGGIAGLVQKAPPLYVDTVIPVEKLLLFRTTAVKNNPEGRSLLRNAYRSWFYLKHIEEMQGVGIERDLAGYPVFRLPKELFAADATEAQKQELAAWRQMASLVRRNAQEAMLLPAMYDEHGHALYDMTLTTAGGSREFSTTEIIKDYRTLIAQTVLADFIMLGHGKTGSFALSSDKTALFSVAIGTFLDIIADVINRYAIPRLFEMNGWDTANLPTVGHSDIEEPAIRDVMDFLKGMGEAGYPVFDADMATHLRKVAGLPEMSEEAEEVVKLVTAADLERRRAEAEAILNPSPAAANAGAGAADAPTVPAEPTSEPGDTPAADIDAPMTETGLSDNQTGDLNQ